jgi:hypothetical protein
VELSIPCKAAGDMDVQAEGCASEGETVDIHRKHVVLNDALHDAAKHMKII